MKPILRKYGLFGRKSAKKPLLNKVHMKRRLRWCTDYQAFTREMWGNVIFSDESQFELYSKSQVYVRRPTKNRFNPRYTQKTMKYGGLSFMVKKRVPRSEIRRGSRAAAACRSRR